MNSSRVVKLPECYRILNLSPGVNWEEVRRSYHALALRYHPDRNHGDTVCEERFKEVSRAFHTLRQYYACGGGGRTSFQSPSPYGFDSSSKNEDFSRENTRNGHSGGTPEKEESWRSKTIEVFQYLRHHERRLLKLDVMLNVTITHQASMGGGTIKVRRSRESFDVKVPRGASEGTLLRIPGKGDAGVLHRERGDLLIRLQVSPAGSEEERATSDESFYEVTLKKKDLLQRKVFMLDTPEGPVLYTLPKTTWHGQRYTLHGQPHPATGHRTRFVVTVLLDG